MFDAFDSSCCSYVHKKFKKKKKEEEEEEKKSFGLGALGFQVISIHFPKKKKKI